MNQSSFFKEVGTFILTFVGGLISLQSLLHFLVTNAGDLKVGNNLYPVSAFLILYAWVPLVLLLVWRFWFIHTRTSNYIGGKSPRVKQLRILEALTLTLLLVSIITAGVFIVLFLHYNKTIEQLLYAGIILSALSLIPLLFALGNLLLQTKGYKQLVTQIIPSLGAFPNQEKITSVVRESIIWIAGWVILAALMLFIFIPRERKSKDSADINKVSARKLIKDIEATKCIDSLFAASANFHSALIINETDGKIDKLPTRKIDLDLAKLYSTNCADSIVTSFTTIKTIKSKITELKNSITTENKPELYRWHTNLGNKLLLIQQQQEKRVEKQIYHLLGFVQPYYVALLLVLLLLSIAYWYVLSVLNLWIINGYDGEKQPPLPEVDFIKFYTVLVLVLFFPILKPLEKSDITFNKPLWTIGIPQFVSAPPKMDTAGVKPIAPAPIEINLYNGEPIEIDEISRNVEIIAKYILALERNPPGNTDAEIRKELKKLRDELEALVKNYDSFKNETNVKIRDLNNSISNNRKRIDSVAKINKEKWDSNRKRNQKENN